MTETPSHFKGKTAINHVAEAQARGILTASEIHGTEVPGHISAAADSARDTCLIFLLLSPILLIFPLNGSPWILLFFLLGWVTWRTGRAAWLGWARLERLHRILEQEKWEIEHNRAQEKEELKELYRAKGFEGKLLDDVIEVLMADGDRLLRVMVEEELGLSLENIEHPIKQGIGAGLGALISGLLILFSLNAGVYVMIFTAFSLCALSAAILASFSQNRLIPAIVWNVAIGALALGLTTFLLKLFY